MTTPVAVYENVTQQSFIEVIASAGRPAILKNLADNWPAVTLARRGDEALIDYLKACDNGRPADIMVGAPAIRGEFFYNNDLSDTNFTRETAGLSATLDRLWAQKGQAAPEAVYIQSVPVQDHFPRFAIENNIPFIPPDVVPHIWAGNPLRVQTHHDLSNNIAVCVSGRRRFTLFPPEQLVNLYVGPFDFTLAGPPVSMVSLENPDFDQYPRFREALAVAEVAELEPGDALYMPYGWWHHVRTLEAFNVLVNYWWNEARAGLGSPYDALLHAVLGIRDMPPPQREMWKVMFDYYVFASHGDPVAHLPQTRQGPLGKLTPELNRKMRQQLIQALVHSVGGRIN